jgi:hypothetical protein
MRPATPLKDAYEFARRKHGDQLTNEHLLRATLLSAVIVRPTTSPEDVAEAKRECKRDLLDLLGGIPRQALGFPQTSPGAA